MTNKTLKSDKVYTVSKDTGGNDGLTKREYFAGQAMAGLLANTYKERPENYRELTEVAVNQADELIKALNTEHNDD
jgi:hypothetical protein